MVALDDVRGAVWLDFDFDSFVMKLREILMTKMYTSSCP
jgi:hypothetical protein